MMSNLKFEISNFRNSGAPPEGSAPPGPNHIFSIAGVRRLLRGLWQWLREVSGDAAYETYLRSAAGRGCCDTARREERAGETPAPLMSREEFYLDSLRRRYSGVSRCC
jgi:hypothetical protein